MNIRFPSEQEVNKCALKVRGKKPLGNDMYESEDPLQSLPDLYPSLLIILKAALKGEPPCPLL